MPNFLDGKALSDDFIKEEVRITLRKSYADMARQREQKKLLEQPKEKRSYSLRNSPGRQCQKCFKFYDTKELITPDWHTGKTKMLYCTSCMEIKIAKRNRLLNKEK